MTNDCRVKQIKCATGFLASGSGLLVLALLNLLQDLTGGVPGPVGVALTFHKGIGPYSGKETIAVLVWMILWYILNKILVAKGVDETKVMQWAYILYAVATLLVFPPFLDMLA